jgi:flavodoxin
MKCIIVYFSQSGNTKKMAYAIRTGIQPFVEQCEIGCFDKIDTKELAAYDLIGVGSPCWDGVPFMLSAYSPIYRPCPVNTLLPSALTV